jgi:arylsulfatase A-like enzyme
VDNVSFENAVAASNWSLPSHASLFSGTYPSKHGSHMIHDRIDASPLLESLHDAGYRSYSVSANGFASHRTGFHEPFDETHYTNGAELF